MTELGTVALPPDWPGSYWLHWAAFTLLVLGFIVLMTLFFIWYERRLVGRLQIRLGPNRVGMFGFLQPIADGLKVLLKEDIIPEKGDKWVFWLAPIVALVPAMMIFAVIPFQDGALLADLNIGVLYIMAVSSVVVIGVFMAGWGSSNKYSLLGAMRTIAQEVSYEIPLVLSIIGVVLMAGSLSINDIVNAQEIPFILTQPLGFLIYFTAALAAINRTPFDLLEAESEVIAGYFTEYSGMKFGMFYLTEYAETLAVTAIVTTLFLGGWQGPLLAPWMWFLIKIVAVFSFIVWIRATLPRLRVDQVMGFAWKFLLPLAIINLLITALQVLLWPHISLWLLASVNMGIMVVLILLFSKLQRFGGGRVKI
jgi:NADH-quinone oxidoreductase subunit H